jgi:3-deoxy-7-phosphoheptulonate synthase
MIVNMSEKATEEQITHVIDRIREAGYNPHVTRGTERTIVAAVGSGRRHEIEALQVAPGVDNVVAIAQPFKLVSKQVHPERTIVQIDGVQIGGPEVVVIAGPCSVESREQLLQTAHAVKRAGASMLRGGAYKPRTSPYDFQGLGVKGLRYLAEARKRTGLPVVTEVLSWEEVAVVGHFADMLQIGARNMQNFTLLRAASRSGKPILLKRGAGATIEEWLMAAEYVLAEGNPQVVLCERGIRTFERATRHTLDLNAVALVREKTHLPVIVDPSHAAGVRSLVTPLSMGALAAGACGLIVEVHPDPAHAMSDGAQSLDFPMFEELARLVHGEREKREERGERGERPTSVELGAGS